MEERIEVTCDCGRTHQVDASFAGKTAKCACGKRIQIPEPNKPVPPPVPDSPDLETEMAAIDFNAINRDILVSAHHRRIKILKVVSVGVLAGLVILFASLWLSGPTLDAVAKETTEAVAKKQPTPWPEPLKTRLLADYGDEVRMVETNRITGADCEFTLFYLDVKQGARFEITASDKEESRVVDVLYGSSFYLDDDPDTAPGKIAGVFDSIGRAAMMPEASRRRLVTVFRSMPTPMHGYNKRDLVQLPILAMANFLGTTQRKSLCARIDRAISENKSNSSLLHVVFDLGDGWFCTLYPGRMIGTTNAFGGETWPMGEYGSVWTVFLDRNKSPKFRSSGWVCVSPEQIDAICGK